MKLNFSNWESPVSPERLALVFDHRNRDYGAYVLRERYEKNVVKALALTFSFGIALILSPLIYRYFNPATPIPIEKFTDIIVDLTNVDDVIPQTIEPFRQMPLPPPSDPVPSIGIPLVVDSVVDDGPPKEPLEIIPGTPDPGGDPGGDPSDLPGGTTGNPGGTDNTTYTYVGEMPVFPGGEGAMMTYLSSHLRYPNEARFGKIEGTVYLSFVIDKNGQITSPSIKKGIGGGCEEEALRVLKTMPSWNPGKQNGIPVNVQFMLPVKFELR